jgi:hypothetical protein
MSHLVQIARHVGSRVGWRLEGLKRFHQLFDLFAELFYRRRDRA